MAGAGGYSQSNRPMNLATPLGEDVLLLEDFKGVEAVSKQFRFRLRAVSTDPAVPVENLLQQPVLVSVELTTGGTRYFHGIVQRAMHVEQAAALSTYELEIVPWSWFLSLVVDCRIFEEMAVPAIIEKVFRDQGYTSKDYALKLSGSYQAREYCVQYRESCLDFVSRLMEEEGIFYFFEHTAQGHRMIVADSLSAFEPCPEVASARYGPSNQAVQFEDLIDTLKREHSVRSRTMSLSDYDFEKPKVKLDVRATDDRYDVYTYPGRYLTRDEGERYAKIRLEEQKAQLVSLEGTSNCRFFTPGYKLTVQDEFRSSSDPVTLLAVNHSAVEPWYRTGDQAPFTYTNDFQAILADVPYRPPRLAPRPFVRGTQTAVVVGPSGEEIWVDKYGRIKVQFFWDRESKDSCWVRVSQTWAGKGWGSIQIPRIGQEVVVDFLEGDPDRPLVIGRVYNAEQMPPYELSTDQTISGVKSRSSKGGSQDNYNELVFEDKKGSEFVRLHAERDKHEYVEQLSYEYVGKDRHLIVDGSQAEKVGGDKDLAVGGGQRESIGGDVSLSISGKHQVKVGQVYTVEGGQEIHIKGGMKVVIDAGMQVSIVGPGGFIDIGPAGVTIQGTMVLINSGGSHTTGTAASPETPKDPKKAS